MDGGGVFWGIGGMEERVAGREGEDSKLEREEGGERTASGLERSEGGVLGGRRGEGWVAERVNARKLM